MTQEDVTKARDGVHVSGDRMASLRKKAKLSQSALAERLHVNKQTVSRIEREERQPSKELLEAWVKTTSGAQNPTVTVAYVTGSRKKVPPMDASQPPNKRRVMSSQKFIDAPEPARSWFRELRRSDGSDMDEADWYWALDVAEGLHKRDCVGEIVRHLEAAAQRVTPKKKHPKG